MVIQLQSKHPSFPYSVYGRQINVFQIVKAPEPDIKEIQLYVMQEFYEVEGSPALNTEVIKPKSHQLICTNNLPVDSNGDWLLKEDGSADWDNTNVVSGEYDFVINGLQSRQIHLYDLLEKVVLRAEANGLFNT